MSTQDPRGGGEGDGKGAPLSGALALAVVRQKYLTIFFFIANDHFSDPPLDHFSDPPLDHFSDPPLDHFSDPPLDALIPKMPFPFLLVFMSPSRSHVDRLPP